MDENDQKDIFNYLKNKSISEIPITGNPRFDQVIQRSKKQHEPDKIDISKREDILLMASMHKEDRNMILAQLIKYLKILISKFIGFLTSRIARKINI